jgi:hypothetical protein
MRGQNREGKYVKAGYRARAPLAGGLPVSGDRAYGNQLHPRSSLSVGLFPTIRSASIVMLRAPAYRRRRHKLIQVKAASASKRYKCFWIGMRVFRSGLRRRWVVEIIRVAKDMIETYGPDAVNKAVQRLDACLESRHMEAAKVWCDVVREIDAQWKKIDPEA